jgi:hypothetical protein
MVNAGVKDVDFMFNHGLQGGIGMISAGRACPAPEIAIEAFHCPFAEKSMRFLEFTPVVPVSTYCACTPILTNLAPQY